MKNCIAVFLLNLKPAKMRGVLSEGMIMCASSPDKVEIIVPPSGVEIGDRVTVEGYPGIAKTLMYNLNFSVAETTSFGLCLTVLRCTFLALLQIRPCASRENFGDCCSRFFIGWTPFISPNQQHQNAQGIFCY